MRYPKRFWILAVISLAVAAGAALFFVSGRDAFAGWLFVKANEFSANKQIGLAGFSAKAASFFSKDPMLHFQLGKFFKEMKEYDPALEEFKKAAVSSPPVSGSFREIGRFHFLDKKYLSLEGAVSMFSKEIELSNDPYSYHLRGILYAQKLGRLEDAEADFRREMELSSSWGAPLNLAWVLFEQGKLKEAEEAIRFTEERAPYSVFVDNGFGVIYLNQGRFRDAIKHLEAAFEKAESLTTEEYREAYPGNPAEYAGEGVVSIRAGIAFNLGVANEKRGNASEAIRWYQKTLEFLPDLGHIGIAVGVDKKTLMERINMLESK